MLTIREQLSFYPTTAPKKYYHLFVHYLAKLWLVFHPDVKVVAVTGSFGKTTTAQIIYRLLAKVGETVVTDINLDTVYNLPLTILRVDRKTKYLVLEVGVDKKREMDFHLQLFRPDIVVITGITPVHSENNLLGSISGIMNEKEKILKSLPRSGTVIANADDYHVRNMINRNHSGHVLWYGLEKKDLGVSGSDVKVSLSGTSFKIVIESKGEIPLSGSFVGKQFIYSFLAAGGVALEERFDLNLLKNIARNFKAMPGRMHLEKGPNGSLVINDSLRANPMSTKAGLETLSTLTSNRKIAVLGEMGELGKYSKEEHKKIGRQIGNLKLDYFIGTGSNMKYAVEEAGKALTSNRAIYADDVTQASKIIKDRIGLRKGDIMYLKGSLLKHMERILIELGGEKITCQKVSCHIYHSCKKCPNLKQ